MKLNIFMGINEYSIYNSQIRNKKIYIYTIYLHLIRHTLKMLFNKISRCFFF